MKDKTKELLQDLERKIWREGGTAYEWEICRDEAATKETVLALNGRRKEYILVMNEVLNER